MCDLETPRPKLGQSFTNVDKTQLSKYRVFLLISGHRKRWVSRITDTKQTDNLRSSFDITTRTKSQQQITKAEERERDTLHVLTSATGIDT